jgi:protein-S-isoprenylcysteine O-methyltransferase Ste14
MHSGSVMSLLWLSFVISWVLAAIWHRRTEKRVGLGRELPYRIILILGYVLVFSLRQNRYDVLYAPSPILAWAAVVASVAGFAFAWWARLQLGALWSATITKKEGHHVVDTGPYAITRHPIYTGLIWTTFCTLFAYQYGITLLRLAGFFLVVLAYWIKARLEEGWLHQELGADAYDDYRARVPMLLPYGPVSN